MQIQANIFEIYPVTALPTPHCHRDSGSRDGGEWPRTHTLCNALISSEVSLSVSAQSALAAACVISLSFQRNSAQTASSLWSFTRSNRQPSLYKHRPWPQSAALNICSEFVLQSNQTLSGNVWTFKKNWLWKGGMSPRVCVLAFERQQKNKFTVEIKITKYLKLIKEEFCSIGVHVQGQLGMGRLICSDTWLW